jgi:hypothetical protein
MCRAEISQPDMAGHLRFMKEAFMSPAVPWDGAFSVSLGNDAGSGRITSVAFVARDGQGLPPVEEEAP